MTRRDFAALVAASPVWGVPSFTDELWTLAKPVFDKTLAHPFLRGLADGTLAKEKFKFYMVQDALYLDRFAKALNLLASKAPREDWALFFGDGAKAAIEEARRLHANYFTSAELAAARIAPTNAAYTNHIFATVYRGGFEDGVAAVLPCYWIYWEVGRALKKAAKAGAPYQKWIDTYSDPAFGAAIDRILAITNSVGRESKDFRDLFLMSVRYEYQFWDMAWREETWQPR